MTSASTSSEPTTSPHANTPPPPPAGEFLANCVLHGERPQPNQVGVIVSQEALAQIEQHCATDLYRELGGVLLGKAFRRQGQQWVAVAAALPAVSEQHGPVHFTFTADVWAKINRDRESHYPHLNIVGWFHTHPDLGVFYSADDVVVHTVAFRELWHIGLVVDPVRQEACFFGWEQQEMRDGLERAISPIEGFYERVEEQATSLNAWRIGRDRSWDSSGRYRGVRPRAPLSGVAMAEDVADEPPPANFFAPDNLWPQFSPAVGVGVGLSSILLMACLLLVVILPMQRKAAALAAVTLALSEQAFREAETAGTAVCPDAQLRLIAPQAGGELSSNTQVSLVGTANHAAATQYTVYIRASQEDGWRVVNQFRRGRVLAILGQVDTTTLPPGSYQLHLSAADRNGQPVGQPCTITFTIK